jgi:Family of unknown function (DUF6152)
MARSLLALLAALTLGHAALAHHSPIVFDRTHKVMLEGTVTEFRWGNPHSWIHLDVADDQGQVANWGIEMNPASTLARDGWRSSTLKPGDTVTVAVYPLRNNEKGGQYVSIKLPDGRALGERESGVL